MSKILDRKSAGYSFALHILRELEHHVGELALQGGLGISLAIDHTRQTGDVDMSVSANCLMQLEAELPGLVDQMFNRAPLRWTRCSSRDSEFTIHWGGQNRSRRLRMSWWPDDEAAVKERIEFQFYAVPDDVLRNYPPQLVCIHDDHTGTTLEFLLGMTGPITALADKVVAIINSPRVRLIDFVDAMTLLQDQTEGDLVATARALESIMSAYTDEPIDDLLRRCLTNRPVLEDTELERQKTAISGKVPNSRIVEQVGDVNRFGETRSHILIQAFALLVGVAYIRGGGPGLHQPPRATKGSMGM